MKSLASPSLFRTIDLLIAAGNPGLKRAQWSGQGAEWSRERHSFNGPSHNFAVEVTTLAHAGRRPWTLIVVKEFWWLGAHSKDFKTFQWARLASGQRKDALRWISEQEALLEQQTAAAPLPRHAE